MCINKIKRLIGTVSLSIIAGTVWCQSTANFFPDKDLMTFGSYYYPEQWNPSQWERDLKNMSEIGIDFTHFAEFAWAELEPEEGKYNFEWLDKSVALAEKYGLKVVLCTPSPTNSIKILLRLLIASWVKGLLPTLV